MDDKTKLQFRKELYRQFARVGKALGNARRLEIVDLLAQAEHTVDHLATKTGMSIASVSQHLQILRAAELVVVRRVGTYAYYTLAGDEVLAVWTAITELARTQLLEIDYMMQAMEDERSGLEEIALEDLLAHLQDGTVTILDARPHDEYAAGHIPGAWSLPTEEVEPRLADLPPEHEFVVYCRSSYCVLSMELAQALQARGYRVRVFEMGMSKWRLAGLPIERGSAEDGNGADDEGSE